MRLFLGLLATCALAPAGEIRMTDRILPLAMDGGGWKTTIRVMNLEAKPARFELVFRAAEMGAWSVPVTAGSSNLELRRTSVIGSLEPFGSVSIETEGTALEISRGFAVLQSMDAVRLAAKAVLKNTAASANVAVPLSPEREDNLVIPFDNSNDAQTTLVWVSETPLAQIDFTFLTPEGKEIEGGVYQFSAAAPITQEMLPLAEKFPATRGRKGIVRIAATYPQAGIYDDLFFTAIALQKDADGPAYVVPSLSTGTWKASRHAEN